MNALNKRLTGGVGALLHSELQDAEGSAIGSVDELILDLDTGEVRYLVVRGKRTRLGGLFQLHWQDVEVDQRNQLFRLSPDAHERLSERGVLADG